MFARASLMPRVFDLEKGSKRVMSAGTVVLSVNAFSIAEQFNHIVLSRRCCSTQQTSKESHTSRNRTNGKTLVAICLRSHWRTTTSSDEETRHIRLRMIVANWHPWHFWQYSPENFNLTLCHCFNFHWVNFVVRSFHVECFSYMGHSNTLILHRLTVSFCAVNI